MSSALYRLTGAVQNAREYLEADADAWETGSADSAQRVYLQHCAKLRRDVSTELEAAVNAVAYAGLPDDVRALVIAAREAWEALEENHVGANRAANLDKALEPFSSRVPYANDPQELPSGDPDRTDCDGPSGGGVQAREWQPHQDYAGEPMAVGEFRDPLTTFAGIPVVVNTALRGDTIVAMQGDRVAGIIYPAPRQTFHHWLGADADRQDEVVRFDWVDWTPPTPAPAPRKRQPWPDAV